jgi:hypothetical protein
MCVWWWGLIFQQHWIIVLVFHFLAQAVYLWNAETGSIDELMQCQDPDDYVTSLSWYRRGI